MGFFGRKKAEVPSHPRQEPRIDLPLTVEGLEQAFGGSVDFSKRPVELAGDAQKTLTLCYVSGMVKMERVSDYVLRPMAQDEGLAQCPDMGAVMSRMKAGALYNLGVEERTTADEAVADLIAGNCLLFLPRKDGKCSCWNREGPG